MSGAGAICVKIYKGNLIVACYDGNIYIFDLNAGDDAVNISGPSNMLLAMDLWNDKVFILYRSFIILTIPKILEFLDNCIDKGQDTKNNKYSDLIT